MDFDPSTATAFDPNSATEFDPSSAVEFDPGSAAPMSRGGKRSEVKPFVAGGVSEQGDPRQFGVNPSIVQGGRGTVVEKPDERAVYARGQAPYRDKREALDEAVNLIESGVPRDQVFRMFEQNSGGSILRSDIEQRGLIRKSEAFTANTNAGTVRDGATDGQMASFDPSSAEEVLNTGKRGVSQLKGMRDSLAFQTGLLSPSGMAAEMAKRAKEQGAAAASGEVAQGIEMLAAANERGDANEVVKTIFTRQGFKGLAALVAESAIPSLATAPAAVAGFVAGGPGGAAAATGIASFGMEFATALGDVLDKRGIDVRDRMRLEAALQDPEVMAEVRERGLKRGLPVATFDALSSAFAGRFIRTVDRAIEAGSVARPGMARFGAGVKEAGMQAGLGMAGEAGGQVATGEYKPLDIIVEGVAEVPGGLVEAASNARGANDLTPGEQFGRALQQDVAGTEFQQGPVDEFARRSLDPSFYSPRTVVPGVPATRVEDMPTEVISPEEAAAMAADAAARKAATKAAAEASKATGEKKEPEDAPTVQPTQPIGVAAVAQGSLAARASAELAGGSGGNAPAGDAAGGAGGAPVAGGGVGAGGRAAAQPVGAVAGAPAPAGAPAQPVQGGAAKPVPSLSALNQKYTSRRQRYTSQADSFAAKADKLEKGAAVYGMAGLKDRQGKAIEEAKLAREQEKLARLEASRTPVLSEPTQGPALEQFTTLSNAMQSVFGRAPVPYVDDSPAAADGFQDDEFDATFVNISESIEMPVVSTIFHEFKHLVRTRADSGDAASKRAEQTLDKVWDMISAEGKRKYAEKYLFKAQLKAEGITVDQLLADPKKLDLLKEEMLADFMGRRATDRRFLRKLAKRDPETFGDFVKVWIETLTNMIDALRGTSSPGIKNVDQFISKLEEAKQVAEDALVEWANSNKPEQPKPKADSTIRKSTRSDEELGAFSPFVSEVDIDAEPARLEDMTDEQLEAVGELAAQRGETVEQTVDHYRYLDADEYAVELKWVREKRELNAELQGDAISDDDLSDLVEPEIDAADVAVSDAGLDADLEAYLVLDKLNGSNPDAKLSAEALAQKYGNWSDEQIKAAVNDAAEKHGYMLENGLPELVFSKGGAGVRIAKDGYSARGIDGRLYIIRPDDGARWAAQVFSNSGGSVDHTWGMSLEEARRWINNAHKSSLIREAGFDLASTVGPKERRALLARWRELAKAKNALSMPQGGYDKDPVAIARNMGLGEFSMSKYGSDFDFYFAKDGSQPVNLLREEVGVYHANTIGLEAGSGAGSKIYPMLFTWARNNGYRLKADNVLSYVNTFRRTEQMFSAALRLDGTSFMQPGKQQRVYGWELNPQTTFAEDANIVRLALASLRNVRELTGLPESVSFNPETGKFSDKDAVREAVSDKIARGASVGVSTIARALVTQGAITNPDKVMTADDITEVSKVEDASGTGKQSTLLYSGRVYTSSAGRIRRTIEEMVESAKSMSDWRDWFRRHEETINEMFGDDAELFQSILAATSQAATVASNVSLALKAYKQFYANEPFDGYLPAVRRNLQRLRAQEDVQGPKISEYEKANTGNPEGMAVDRHIAELMFNTARPNRRQIRAAHRRMLEIARRLGWEPREVQSALWAFNQVRKGKDPNDVQSYDTLLKQRAQLVAETRRVVEGAKRFRDSARGTGFTSGRRDGLQSVLDGAGEGDVQSGIRDEGQADFLTRADGLRFSARALDAATVPDDGILFSGKEATLAAMAELPKGYKPVWFDKEKVFKIIAPDGLIAGMGKKVVLAVADYKAKGGKTGGNTFKSMDSPGAQAQMHGDVLTAMGEPDDLVTTSAEASKFIKDNGLYTEWSDKFGGWAVKQNGSSTMLSNGKSVVEAVNNYIGKKKAGKLPTQLTPAPASPVAQPAAAPAKPASNEFEPTPESIKKLFTEYSIKGGVGSDPFKLDSQLTGLPQGMKVLQPNSQEFKRWAKGNKVLDKDGKMPLFFHGTGQTFYIFKPKQAQAIFGSRSLSFAKSFADMSAGWMLGHGMGSDINRKVFVMWMKAEKPWDFQVEEDIEAVMREVKKMPFADVKAGVKQGTYGFDIYAISDLESRLRMGKWQAIESPPVQQAMRKLGYDGFWMIEGSEKNFAVYKQDQVKLALMNVGAFGQRPITQDEADLFGISKSDADALQKAGDMRFSARAGQKQLRDFSVWAKVVEAIQDRYNRWKQAVEDIRKQGGSVTEDNDFYLAEERYWGKVGSRIEDFKQDFEEWVESLNVKGNVIVNGVRQVPLTLEEVALYAYAEHAKDRNAYIASVRPTMPDGGSGMTNDEAQAILDDAEQAGVGDQLRAATAKLRSYIQGTRDILFNDGLITRDEYDNWTLNMQSYVPLRGLPPSMDGSAQAGKPGQGTGQGFNIRGAESKRMMGRKSEAKQIIEHIVADRTRALIRSGKNEVLRHFLKFVLDNPAKNLWEVNAVQTKPVSKVDANGDRIIEEEQRIVSDDNTVTVKDGGEEIHILVRDETLRKQLQNLNSDQVNVVVGALLFVNRILSRLYTSLSPVFTVINFARDVTAAGFGAIDEMGFIGATKLYAKLPGAMVESMAAEFGSRSTDYDLYRSAGGKTGFFDFKTVDDLSREMKRLVAQSERSMADPRKLAPAMLNLIESINAGIENATRLAAFKAAIAEGETVARASSIAKNITVNFNRKGTMTPALSAWFLFFNPAVQGTTRMLKALSSPKVMSTLGLAMGGMFALALRNAGMGEDDDGMTWWDKIPSEVKERNIIIVLPPKSTAGEEVPGSKVGRYVKIPMPYGYNFFAVVANQVADVWRNSKDASKGVDTSEAMKRAFGAFMGSWVPVAEIGGAFENTKSLALAATPDAFNPVVQNILNVNPFGRPLYPEGTNDRGLPDSSKAFAGQRGTVFDVAARGMNDMAGGNAVTPPPGVLSILDMAPGSLENLTRGYLGGPMTFVLDIANTVYARTSLERPEADLRRLPFAKQVYGVIDDETDRMLGYSRMEKAEELINRINAGKKLTKMTGDSTAEQAAIEDAGPMGALDSDLKRVRKTMSELRKQELEIIGDPEASSALKYERMLKLNTARRRALQDFNAAYAEAQRALRQQSEAQRTKQ